MHSSWKLTTLKDVLPKLEALDGEIIPHRDQIFKAYELGLEDIKVVILGQDPYPTKGHAHGLAFSCLPHVKPIPGSLRNIFKEYSSDLGFPTPRNGDLRAWAERGVFLLNTALTVQVGKPGSHAHIWSKLTYETVSELSRRREKLVWMLWGKKAQEYQAAIDSSKHLVLTAGHPSPLSVKQFLGCKHFTKACDYLSLPKEFWKL